MNPNTPGIEGEGKEKLKRGDRVRREGMAGTIEDLIRRPEGLRFRVKFDHYAFAYYYAASELERLDTNTKEKP